MTIFVLRSRQYECRILMQKGHEDGWFRNLGSKFYVNSFADKDIYQIVY